MANDVEELTGLAPSGFVMTQFATTRYGGLWILFGELKSCIVEARDGALACAFTHNVMTHGLSLGVAERGLLGGRIYTMQGVVPNWARSARLDVGGDPHTIEVKNNVYALQGSRRIWLREFVAWDEPGGRESMDNRS